MAASFLGVHVFGEGELKESPKYNSFMQETANRSEKSTWAADKNDFSLPAGPGTVGWGSGLCGFLERREVLSITLVLVVIFVTAFTVSAYRPMWFDEVLTIMVATRPDMSSFMAAMPADGSPPLLHLMVRALSKVVGPTQLAARLPSMLGFTGACLALYLFVRRRCGVAIGFLAVAIMASEPGWWYAFESRPYALLLGFTMLTLLSWQRAAERREDRGLALFGMVAGVAGVTLSHQLGLLEITFVIFIAEAWRWRETKRLDWPLYATFLIALPLLTITIPMMRHTRDQVLTVAIATRATYSLFTPFHWLGVARKSFRAIFGLSTLLLGVPLVIAVVRRRRGEEVGRRDLAVAPGYEVAAAVALLLLLPLTLCVMMPVNNYYECRYAIAALGGIGILGGFGFAAIVPNRRDVIRGAMGVCALLFVWNVFNDVRDKTRAVPVLSEYVSGIDPDIPIMTDSCFQFYPVWWYGSESERARLHYSFNLADPMEVAEKSALLERGRFPMQVEPEQSFLARYPRFVGYQPTAALWDRLNAMGYRRKPLGGSDRKFWLFER